MASSADEYATADSATPSRSSVEPEAAASSLAVPQALEDALAGLTIAPAPRRARVRVAIQDACRKHRFLRWPDDSGIVERPLRLRAVNLGIAAAHARLSTPVVPEPAHLLLSGDIEVVRSSARLDLASRAVAFVHSESNESPDGSTVGSPAYPTQFKTWALAAAKAHAAGASETPSHLPQGDLYLCAESVDAVEGALGTSCEAVDQVMRGDSDAMFVAIRPPGHHCGNATVRSSSSVFALSRLALWLLLGQQCARCRRARASRARRGSRDHLRHRSAPRQWLAEAVRGHQRRGGTHHGRARGQGGGIGIGGQPGAVAARQIGVAREAQVAGRGRERRGAD